MHGRVNVVVQRRRFAEGGPLCGGGKQEEQLGHWSVQGDWRDLCKGLGGQYGRCMWRAVCSMQGGFSRWDRGFWAEAAEVCPAALFSADAVCLFLSARELEIPFCDRFSSNEC